MSPFQLIYRCEPRTSFDWTLPNEGATVRQELSYQEATDMAKKLRDGWERARTIMRRNVKTYKLDLSESMNIHPVFYPDRLRLDPQDPLSGQVNDPVPPIRIDNQDKWEVEDLIVVRKRYDKLEYRAKWVGHDEDPAWYPATNFKYSLYRLRMFHL